jgi:hypothetical protein
LRKEINISILSKSLADKARQVKKTRKPQLHTMYIKSMDENMLTDIMWYDGDKRAVMIEILNPLDLETKHIFKINLNKKEK